MGSQEIKKDFLLKNTERDIAMSKFIKRVGLKKENLLISMKIVSVTIPVKEPF